MDTPLWQAEDVSISRVVDLDSVRFAATDLYPDANPDAVRTAAARFGPHFIDAEQCELLLSFHSFVVRTGGLTILVDTCIGNDKDRPNRPGWHRRSGDFLAALARTGVRPDDVDYVMCTHLHADHVGWNTRLIDGVWRPTFPRAQYVMSETEFHFWNNRNDSEDGATAHGSFADSVLPVAASGQALLVPSDYIVAPGVAMEPAPGHTPGNVIVQVAKAGQQAVLCGDVLHHPIQLLHPQWSTHFCSDPALSRQTRTLFLERFANSNALILAAHFQSPTGGHILRDNQAFDFSFMDDLSGVTQP